LSTLCFVGVVLTSATTATKMTQSVYEAFGEKGGSTELVPTA
jgi:hypothetical protein